MTRDNSPSCSWPLQVRGTATAAQAGVVRCYLRDLAHRDIAGLYAIADLGGTVAVVVGFAAFALAWYVPVSERHLADPPATARAVTIAWYAIAAVAFVVTGAAMRDPWHRYLRRSRLCSRQRVVMPTAD
jgi:hypothetical protein